MAEVPGLEPGDSRVRTWRVCHFPYTPSSPGVFAPPGVTALFLPKEGPDTDSQDGRVIRVGEVGFEPTHYRFWGG